MTLFSVLRNESKWQNQMNQVISHSSMYTGLCFIRKTNASYLRYCVADGHSLEGRREPWIVYFGTDGQVGIHSWLDSYSDVVAVDASLSLSKPRLAKIGDLRKWSIFRRGDATLMHCGVGHQRNHGEPYYVDLSGMRTERIIFSPMLGEEEVTAFGQANFVVQGSYDL